MTYNHTANKAIQYNFYDTKELFTESTKNFHFVHEMKWLILYIFNFN